ncbi:MAG TPA: hypothetical protein VEH81_12250 [Ktedonobacteraceae bacterium]|nr:hypothetical protein [Ktedonobacteraceae bacterium]
MENDGNTEPYLPYSAFDLSNISEELSSPHPELDLSNEAAKLHVSDSDPKGMTEQVKHGLAEVLRSEEKGQEGYYLKVNGDGTVIPKHFSLINSPILTPYPLTPHLYQEYPKYSGKDSNAEIYVRVSDHREHNKPSIQVMRVGAITILIGVLLIAFSMANRLEGVTVTVGVILALIGGITYAVGLLVAFFNPPHKRGNQVGELVEQLDSVRDFDWGILAFGLHGLSVSTPVSPPPAQNLVHTPITATSSAQTYQGEIQTMARQNEQKAISGAAPPVNMLSSSKAEQLSSHFTHQEKTNTDTTIGEPMSMHDNEASKKIDEALEPIDEMGAIEAMKKSPHEEDEREDRSSQPYEEILLKFPVTGSLIY